ncbi:MAG: RsmD family RNA methyltransferase [Myxococcota bacterium]
MHLDGGRRGAVEPLKTPRLTGGRARGRALAAIPDEGVRPTSARVREALFSMIGHELAGLAVLDACAGSGLLGLEAWSRGARVTAVEQAGRAFRQLRANVAALEADVTLMRGDVLTFGERLGAFDGILLDPPYALDPLPFLATLAAQTTDWLVLESDGSRNPPEVPALAIDRRRTYGGTSLTIYRRQP